MKKKIIVLVAIIFAGIGAWAAVEYSTPIVEKADATCACLGNQEEEDTCAYKGKDWAYMILVCDET